jgi:hypothetical protein
MPSPRARSRAALASSSGVIVLVCVGQPNQARIDFAAIESELEVIQKQLARLPTRRELAGTALGIIFTTMMLTTLSLLFLVP